MSPTGSSGSDVLCVQLLRICRGSLISLSPLTGDALLSSFKLQAVDDAEQLQRLRIPTPTVRRPGTRVSIRVVALKEIEAGQQGALNDDRGLTPDDRYAAGVARCRRLAANIRGIAGKKEGNCRARGRCSERELSLCLTGVPNITADCGMQRTYRLSLRGSASAHGG